MYCGKCGRENKDGDLYCSNCGNKFDGLIDKHEIVDKKQENVKRKLNPKIVFGIVALIVITIGTTVFLLNKSKISQGDTVTQSSADTSSKATTDTAKDLSAAEKVKEDELAVKEKTANEAKEAFGKLLQDKVWLCKNANYANNGSNTFSILDINQDGVPEMLLSNSSGGLANYSLSVVTYNNGNVNVEVINTSHGGFSGYLSDEKVFLINGSHMGYTWGAGYKLEGNQCKEMYSWKDNLGIGPGKELEYQINEAKVSEAEYKEFCEKFKNADSNSNNFYQINNDNIKKVLGVEPIKVEQTNESIKDIAAYKNAISKGIREAMKEKFNKNVSNNIYKYSTPVSFKNGKLYYGEETFDGLVAVKNESSKYIFLSSFTSLDNITEYTTHSPGNDIVAWAKLRDDGIYEVRGQYMFALQVNSDKNSIISNYNSNTTMIDDSCILVYPDGTVNKAGKLNDSNNFEK